jgi:RNA polymerase sigma-70 factor (ECF subfamily)
LAAEVALLKKAQKEYQAHNYTRALALVEEHRRKFPHGGLVQEGITLRMRLLCALGRDEDAVREQGALQRVSSGHTSPQPDKPCQNL